MKFLPFLLVLFLSACIDFGDDCSESSAEEESCIEDIADDINDNNPGDTITPEDDDHRLRSDATLAELEGVWESNEELSEGQQKHYQVIRANGETFYYSYLLPSTGPNNACYLKSDGMRIESLGSGDFSMTDIIEGNETHLVHFDISGNNLTAYSNKENEEISFTKTSLLESQLNPLCSNEVPHEEPEEEPKDPEVPNTGDTNATLEDLVGIWQVNQNSSEGSHTYYLAINGNSELITYTFLSGENAACYFKVPTLNLVSLGDGSFSIIDKSGELDMRADHLYVSGNTLTISSSLSDLVITFSKSNMVESQLNPVCNETEIPDAPETPDNNTTLQDIVGVWDGSGAFDEGIDIWYSVIKANGDIIEYDYEGDSFGSGEKCYWRYDDTHIEDLGNGQFLISSDFDDEEDRIISISVKEDTMSMLFSYGDTQFEFTNSRVNQLESNFTPLCEDI